MTKLAFRDRAGRDHMTTSDGQQDSLDELEDYLRSLLDRTDRWAPPLRSTQGPELTRA